MNLFNRRDVLRMGAATAVAPFFSAYGQGSDDKRLGVALLGLGDYATSRLGPALKQTRNARLTGIVTGTPEKIPVWQKEYGIADGNVYTYQNFDTIADNKEIDIVYVVTPTALHSEFAIRAAAAGKHVICEKPMAPTVVDCNRMIEASKKAGKSLQIGYRLHWDPYHRQLMELVAGKKFGDWISISAFNGGRMTSFTGLNAWRIDKQLGVAGALYDLGVYCVQASLYTARENPVSVEAKIFNDRPDIFKGVAETYDWLLEFAGGRTAEGMASYGRNANFIRAKMDKGTIEIEPAYTYDGLKGRTPDGTMQFPSVNQQALQIDGQVEAILTNTPSRVPGEMGCRDVQILQGIVEAAETGKPVVFGKFAY
jgi:predicted dehydrogenase